MSDKYIDFVATPIGAAVATRLGLPRPVRLRRWEGPGTALVNGPTLVLADDASRPDAEELAAVMRGWGLQVRHETQLAGEDRWGAVVVVLTELPDPGQLGGAALALGATLRQLGRCARVVTVSRPVPEPGDCGIAVAAARAGVEGFVRSVAQELRSGATANGLLLADPVPPGAPAALGALRFLLSPRSAFVNGQLLRVDGAGEAGDPERPLAGRVAAVTGAARGIGAEILRTLARDGAAVVGVDVPAAGEHLAAVVNAVRGSALQLDVTAPDAADRIHRHAVSRHGRLDIVVHNAGILRDKLLANMTPERWEDLIAVNILAPVRMNERFVELAEAGELGGSPRVISLASTSGIAGNRGQTNYAAAKAGIIGMTTALADAMAAAGGTANAVAPWLVESEMSASMPALRWQIARRLNTLRQAGLPRDVAEVVAFLSSAPAGGINGQVLRVCGQFIGGR